MVGELKRRLADAEKDARGAVDLLWDTAGVVGRFDDTGPVAKAVAADIGLVGPAARASGLARDVRADHPSGFYRWASVPVSTAQTGDVYARARVRWLEAARSMAFIAELLASLPDGAVRAPMRPLGARRTAVALVEAWRGEVAHVVATDAEGRIDSYKVVDPSFHNWLGLAVALRGQAISDFPLCNKSFNLSYCGHDL
jgi:Ni,Fe-hydrogenase III large subunit